MENTLPPRTEQRPKPRDLNALRIETHNKKRDAQATKNCADGPDGMEQRIRAAMCLVAELLQHSDAYLPIFLRLEAELAAAESRRAALERAKAFLDPSP